MGPLAPQISADVGRVSNGLAGSISIADSSVLDPLLNPFVVLPHFLIDVEYIFVSVLLQRRPAPQPSFSLTALLSLVLPGPQHFAFVESAKNVEVNVFDVVLGGDVDAHIGVGWGADPRLNIFNGLDHLLFAFLVF